MQPRTIGILGGGSAGHLAALAVRAKLSHVAVTLIESSRVPIIGVGEGTTPSMVAFLHGYLGLDVAEFYAQVKPTWKLGVRLFWGQPGDYFFNFPFDGKALVESYAYTGDINCCSLGSLMMADGLGPVLMRHDWSYESLLKRIPFAYHLDNRRFVRYLREQADRIGVERVDALVEEVELAADGTVAALVSDDGRRFSFDLYLDCSGFRSRLLGDALASPFRSYSPSLFTDTALVAQVPHAGAYGAYTDAESMDSGWCWSIPELSAHHRGYVFSSAFATVDEAAAEMHRKNPGMGDPRAVAFRPGRREHWWKGNVVAIGNAYGFVEPLEATALHMVVKEIAHLVGNLKRGPVDAAARERLNGAIGECWDYICGHLALHYKYNRKLDTPFWRECRANVDLLSLTDAVAQALARGPLVGQRGQQLDDASFALDNIADETDILLLGQKVLSDDLVVPREPRDTWEERLSKLQALKRRALSPKASFETCLQNPALCEPEGQWYQTLLRSLEEPVSTRSARS